MLNPSFTNSERIRRFYKQRKWKWQPKRIRIGIIVATVLCAILILALSATAILSWTSRLASPRSVKDEIHAQSQAVVNEAAQKLHDSLPNMAFAGAPAGLGHAAQTQMPAVDSAKASNQFINAPVVGMLVSQVESIASQLAPSAPLAAAASVQSASTASGAVAVALASPAVTQNELSIPVLIFACNRADNLRRTIQSVLQHLPTPAPPIFVSVDGQDAQVLAVIGEYQPRVSLLKFDFKMPATLDFPHMITYYRIAQHYGWALKQVMDEQQVKHEHILLLEDDMLIAPDTFSYFAACARIMQKDESILAASAWNDGGQSAHVRDPTQLYRTEVFPGLGWLLTRRIWTEIGPKWPLETGFWDDWLRVPEQRKGRSCIIPEVSRVYTFGEQGASAGQFYNEFLRDIKMNSQPLDWLNDSMLQQRMNRTVQSHYDVTVQQWIHSAQQRASVQGAKETIAKLPALPEWQLSEMAASNETLSFEPGEEGSAIVTSGAASEPSFLVLYSNLEALTPMLRDLQLMTDHKSGLPRTSYKGLLVTRHLGYRILLLNADSEWLKPKTEAR